MIHAKMCHKSKFECHTKSFELIFSILCKIIESFVMRIPSMHILAERQTDKTELRKFCEGKKGFAGNKPFAIDRCLMGYNYWEGWWHRLQFAPTGMTTTKLNNSLFSQPYICFVCNKIKQPFFSPTN